MDIPSRRLTTGDYVQTIDGMKGVIERDDHDSQPYFVVFDSGEDRWCSEDELHGCSEGPQYDEAEPLIANLMPLEIREEEEEADPNVDYKAKLAKKLGLSRSGLDDLFGLFDTDGTNTINGREFRTVMASLGVPLPLPVANALVTKLDRTGNGQLNLDDFSRWFGSRDWDVNLATSDFGKSDQEKLEMWEEISTRCWYDWDYSKDEDENLKLAAESKAASKATKEFVRDSDMLNERREALMFRLMMPLYIKKALRAVNQCGAQDPAGVCTSNFAVTLGATEPAGNAELFVHPTPDGAFESLNPVDKRSGTAGVVDFSIRDDADPEDLDGIVAIVNKCIEAVLPMIKSSEEYRDLLHQEVRTSGLFCGSPFEGFRIGVEEVDGEKVLRLVGFSGFDPAFLIKDIRADIAKLLPTFSAKLSTGSCGVFGDQTLGEVLTGSLEVNLDWHAKLVELVVRAVMSFNGLRISMDEYASVYETEEHDQIHTALMGMSKFFQAHRSLLMLQFDSVFEALKQTAKESKAAVFAYGLDQFFPEPPTDEQIDDFFNAVSSISGKTWSNLRDRFLDEFEIMFNESELGQRRCGSRAAWVKPMDFLKLQLKGLEAQAAQSGDYSSPEEELLFKLSLALIRLYFKAQRSLVGFKGAKLVNRALETGIQLQGLADVFAHLPSLEQFNSTTDKLEPQQSLIESLDWYDRSDWEKPQRRSPGPAWVEPYVDSLFQHLEEGGAEPTRPSDEYLASLREDFSEVLAVIKAAVPFLETLKRDNLDVPPEISQSVEDEARRMFGLV
eukprot:TRINITY_DN26004_c0_g1_i1.p1 TRINITY_DN26004_c0_g1~~TRINITY_DN26004_c0_g1_i1.p1  ORF type:complete len:785 (-),score=206.36 TRINITY_DN26004_c0_g1_i1:274-2628(-)